MFDVAVYVLFLDAFMLFVTEIIRGLAKEYVAENGNANQLNCVNYVFRLT